MTDDTDESSGTMIDDIRVAMLTTDTDGGLESRAR